MSRAIQSDEAFVEHARRTVPAKRRMRWVMLLYACLFLGLSGYFTVVGIRKIENLDAGQLSGGFVYGLALAVVRTSLGVLGALCLGKFLAGFGSELRAQELMIRYHDRLRELRDLSDEKNGEPGGPVVGSQPLRSERSRTPSAAGSCR